MNENTTLNELYTELNLDVWWHELVGQEPTFDNFDIQKALDRLPRTEVLAAEEISRKFANRLTYMASEDCWYLWDGLVHAPCNGDAIAVKVAKLYYKSMVDATNFIREYYEKEAIKIESSNTADSIAEAKKMREKYSKGEVTKHKNFRDRMSSDAGLSAVVRVLKTECDIPADHFDGDRKFLVVRNGVIDLSKYRVTGNIVLEAHDPKRPVYRYFDADYHEEVSESSYPIFRKFLNESIIDWDTACLLQMAVGAGFSGADKPRAMINLLGAPSSGKSMFLTIFKQLGQGYSAMPDNQAIQQFGNDTNPYQDEMAGARFIGFSEVQGNKPLNDGFIKKVMGGDLQTTRRLYGQPRKWYPQGVMFVASNMPLKIDTRDEATFMKILPITFPHTFTKTDSEHRIDETLQDQILGSTDGDDNVLYPGERSGLLHWVLRGIKLYWDNGLVATESVMRAMDASKTANSYSLAFIKDLLDTGLLEEDLGSSSSSYVLKGEAYKAFKYWCEGQNVKNVTGKQTFNSDVESFYHGEANSGGKRFKGLKMTPEWKITTYGEEWVLATAMKNLDEREKLNF